MTGLGSDNVTNPRKFKGMRGKIIARNENSRAVYGMPPAAAEEDLADRAVSGE